ncbi:MAG: T9SS type A sorting domain-containing protein [Bacteroidia bacterium]|nr:T9SS type A sorting domain-containing protein [Bacteroidia bacterium]
MKHEQGIPAQLRVIPNPTTENLTIVLPNDIRTDDCELYAYDLIGNLINVSYTLRSNNIIVDSGRLTKGMYIIEIRTSDSIFGRTKIIKM